MMTGWWIRAAVVAGCVAAGCGACSRTVTSPGIEGARQAFISHDVSRAEGLYIEVAGSDTASAVDRAAAFRRLAALAWRYRLDADSGRGLLERALEVGADSSSTFSELARLETAAGRTAAAMDAAESAIRTATTSEDRIRAVARLAAAAVDPVRTALLDEGRWPDDAARSKLRQALERLRPLNDSVPGVIETSLLQLEAALLLDDGAAALAGWRSYYALHLERGGPLPAAHETLSRTLGEWRGHRTPAVAREEAIEALAASGRHDAALIVAADPRASTEATAARASTAEVIAYSLAMHRVEALTDEYYRATAVGSGDPDAYRDALFAEAERLWRTLDWPGGNAPEFEEQAFGEEIGRRFGAQLRIGETAGFYDLHLGHRVVDEPRTVEQYGHRADLRYVALDGIVSNGFQTWAWDGDQAHGGWADANTIVQVRPRYAAGPLRAWQSLTDSIEWKRSLEEQMADSVADIERARGNPYAYLPGLNARLYRQDMVALRDSLRAAGLEGDALRAAFMAAYDVARTGSSIFAHEGRHALERRMDLDLEIWEREYRAKLSEVVFARRPRLALHGGILNANIGDDTPHGRANLRLMRELVEWIDVHRAEIDGFDATLPLLPQLSLLTDAQLRDAFRSLDPFAQTAADGPAR